MVGTSQAILLDENIDELLHLNFLTPVAANVELEVQYDVEGGDSGNILVQAAKAEKIVDGRERRYGAELEMREVLVSRRELVQAFFEIIQGGNSPDLTIRLDIGDDLVDFSHVLVEGGYVLVSENAQLPEALHLVVLEHHLLNAIHRHKVLAVFRETVDTNLDHFVQLILADLDFNLVFRHKSFPIAPLRG